MPLCSHHHPPVELTEALPHPSDPPPPPPAPLRAAPEVPDGAPEAPFWPSPHSSKLRDGIHQCALQLPLWLSSPSWLHASYYMYWISGASIPGNTQGINFGLPGQLPQEYSARMHYAQTSSEQCVHVQKYPFTKGNLAGQYQCNCGPIYNGPNSALDVIL